MGGNSPRSSSVTSYLKPHHLLGLTPKPPSCPTLISRACASSLEGAAWSRELFGRALIELGGCTALQTTSGSPEGDAQPMTDFRSWRLKRSQTFSKTSLGPSFRGAL
jgi:hypothetical protein